MVVYVFKKKHAFCTHVFKYVLITSCSGGVIKLEVLRHIIVAI